MAAEQGRKGSALLYQLTASLRGMKYLRGFKVNWLQSSSVRHILYLAQISHFTTTKVHTPSHFLYDTQSSCQARAQLPYV